MRFFEVASAVDAITGAAMVAQTRASAMDKVARISMDGFLQMLQNAGVVLDYEGFKSVFDNNPQLQNVISKFDKSSITFAAGDVDDEDGYEEPTTDMPDDERVAKMAKRAMRAREFVEAKEVGVYKEIGGVRYYAVKNKSGKEKLFTGPTPAAKKYAMTEAPGDDDLLRPMVNMKGQTLKRYGASIAKKYPHLAKSVKAMMPTESELPPHLSKMFGDDGKQVDTRTEVMRQMRDIVANKQAMKVKFGDGDQMIDMFTASVLTQIYDKVNDNSKEAIIQRIGTKEKFMKLMPKLYGLLEGFASDAQRKAAFANGYDPKKKKAKNERSLTKAEKAKMRSYEKKISKADFVDRYGKEGEAIYYGTITKMAKKNA